MRVMFCSLVLALSCAAPAGAQNRDQAVDMLRDVATRCPRAYANAHRDENQHPEAWDFIILATQALKRVDPLFALNGKRGDARNLSSDALAYGVGRNVRIYDVIVAGGTQGNDLSKIAMQDVTADSTVDGVVMGIAVDPDSRQPLVPCGTAPVPTPLPGAGWESKHNELLLQLGQPAGARDPAYVRRVAEQFAYSFPGEGWGTKSADPSRPPSGDVVARQSAGGLVGYRVVPPTLHPAPISLTGQHFIAVAPINHLGIAPGEIPTPTTPPAPLPTPIPAPTPAPTSIQPLLDALVQLRSLVEQLNTKADALGVNSFALADRLAELARDVQAVGVDTQTIRQVLAAQPTTADFPEYVGSILGRTVILRPRR